MIKTLHRRQLGVTLVEILVVLAIIGILSALLVVGVGVARESTRKISCKNNLRQIGGGVLMFEQSHRRLPYSISPWREGKRPLQTGRSGKGWMVDILPFIEQKAVAESLQPVLKTDFFSGGGMRDPSVRNVVSTPIGLLACPSDTSQRVSTTSMDWNGIEVAVSSYKGVLGSVDPSCVRNCDCDGVFFRTAYQKSLGLKHVTDGQSQTFFIGEDIPQFSPKSAALYANGDWASCVIPLNHIPKNPTLTNAVSFKSLHSGGANFCLGDGSVRFINEDINMEVYQAYASRNGGD